MSAVARRAADDAVRADVTARARRRQAWKVYGAFGSALVLTMMVAPLVGSTALDPWRVFDRTTPWADNLDAQIFFIARLPRVIAAALVGATLASAGVVVQALLRNPLATPFTLGVSSGSALGAMLALTFLPTWGIGVLTAVPLASLAGAFGAVLIVYGLAQARHRGFSTEVLLLAGVTLNAFFSALILLVQYLSDFTQTVRTLRWLMGDLDVGSVGPLLVALPLLLVAWALFAWLPRSLNVLALGAEQAGTRGVPVLLVQRVAFFSASLATGVVVSLAGPIGFVGIIVPHLVRVMVGADHRIVLPAAFLFGGAFMVLCDTLARTIIAPVELPVGVVTATIGGPFFLWLLVVRRR
jgi:iron complex transport system permease protein